MGVLNKEFKARLQKSQKKGGVDVRRLARVRKVLWYKGLGKGKLYGRWSPAPHCVHGDGRWCP